MTAQTSILVQGEPHDVLEVFSFDGTETFGFVFDEGDARLLEHRAELIEILKKISGSANPNKYGLTVFDVAWLADKALNMLSQTAEDALPRCRCCGNTPEWRYDSTDDAQICVKFVWLACACGMRTEKAKITTETVSDVKYKLVSIFKGHRDQ